MNVDPPSDNRRRIWKATILVTGVALLIVAGVTAIGVTVTRSDSPFSESKQAFLNRLRNPPTSNVAVGVTAAPGWPTPNDTPSTRPDGLYDTGLAPYSSMEYAFDNQWQGHLDGDIVFVYAGQLGYFGKDVGRGVLVMDSNVTGLGGSFDAPVGVGSLHIVSYEGTVLTIQAATGETFYFDAQSRAFTDASGNPVPTDSPTPTPAPQFTPVTSLPFELPTPTPPATAQPTVAATAAAGLGG